MNNKGITLVALVITIVILLILSGVGISLIIGQEGIITKAQEAKYRYQLDSIIETAGLELNVMHIEQNEGTIISDTEKVERVYDEIVKRNLNEGTQRAGNLLIIADKYVVSMKEGREAILGKKPDWNYYTATNWKGYSDSDYLNWAFITGYTGTEKNITIPEYVIENGKICIIREIRQNWDGGFSNNSNIESITILDNILKIEQTEFADMENLKKVTIADSVKSIANDVFSKDYKLEEVKLPVNLERIENSTFLNCYALKEITIPSKVTSIGDHAFLFCISLEKIEIPSSVKSIGEAAFAYIGIDESNTVTSSMGSGDTKHTELGYTKGKIKEIILNEGLESIANNAFLKTSTVEKNLKLPSTLTSIGENAFFRFGTVGGGKVYNYDDSIYNN